MGTEPEVANVFKGRKYLDWVRTPAREVDLETEIETVQELSQIMSRFLQENNWVAVSSNNIYWPKLSAPIRVVKCPLAAKPDEYLTLINPRVSSKNQTGYSFGEDGCGSMPGLIFYTLRPKLTVSGFVLEDCLAGDMAEKSFNVSDRSRARYLEHELDHLDGKLIADIGILIGYATWPANRGLLFDENFFEEKNAPLRMMLNLAPKRIEEDYLPRGYLRLVLTVENEGSYWTMHSKGCRKQRKTHDNQLTVVAPDTAGNRDSFLYSYPKYADITRKDSFATISLEFCDCMKI